MKSTKHILFLVTLMFSTFAIGQIVAGNSKTLTAQDLLMSYDSGKVDGSPYLSSTLEYGTVKFNNGTADSYFMRYNIYNDQIEFSKTNDESTLKGMPYDPSVVFGIADKNFQYIDFSDQNEKLAGIFEIIKIYDQNNLLVRKYTKRIQEPEGASKSSYSSNSKSRFVSDEKFYLIQDDAIVNIDNHKRRSLNAFDDSKEKELKNFIKERDIDFDDDGKGLAEVVAYYRSLQ